MKKIEITTAQNVTIQYNLATISERFLAFLMDLLGIVVVALLLWWLVSFLFDSTADIAFYLLVLPWIFFYSLGWEYLNNGVSFGKTVMRLRVIRLDGETPLFQDYMMRWIFRPLDIYFTFGGVGIICIVSSAYGQRLGDVLANTVVVNVGRNSRVQLDKLLKLNSKVQHKVRYPQVTKIPEEAMVLVKTTLARHLEFNNETHEAALNELAGKMEELLGVKAPGDKRKFLTGLLNDFVVLTR